MQLDGPLLLELKTSPQLGFVLTVQIEGKALRFFVALDPVAAQALALALVAQPEVGNTIKPELAEAVLEEIRGWQQTQQADAEFLKAAGVQTT